MKMTRSSAEVKVIRPQLFQVEFRAVKPHREVAVMIKTLLKYQSMQQLDAIA